MYKAKKIISVYLCFAIVLFAVAVPAYAAELPSAGGTLSAGNFWTMLGQALYNEISKSSDGVSAGQFFNAISSRNDSGCPNAPNGNHFWVADPAIVQAHSYLASGKLLLHCQYCRETYGHYLGREEDMVDSSDLFAVYDEYVSELDTTTASSGIMATGFSAASFKKASSTGALWSPFEEMLNSSLHNGTELMRTIGLDKIIIVGVCSESPYYLLGFYWNDDGEFCVGRFNNPVSAHMSSLLGVYLKSDLVRIGNYGCVYFMNYNLGKSVGPLYYSWDYVISRSDFEETEYYVFNSSKDAFLAYSAANTIRPFLNFDCKDAGASSFPSASYCGYMTSSQIMFDLGVLHFDYGNADDYIWDNSRVIVQPRSSSGSNGELVVQSAATRPTSIVGSYGILGDDNTLTKIDNVSIVNETDNSVYNPVTDTTYDLSGWTYDYSTRTYDLSTTEGDTITVTYGDEFVTINEGDTVYNVYYVIETADEDNGSGGSGGAGGGSGSEISVPSSIPSGLAELRDKLLGFFANIPQMFGEFTEFLSEGFPYVPEEITALITFGIAIAVMVGIYKLFWR